GRLFGSVTAQDVAAAIREARGLRIDRRNVHLPEPIKNVGTYMVVVDVVEGTTATVKTMVVATKSLLPSADPVAGARAFRPSGRSQWLPANARSARPAVEHAAA